MILASQVIDNALERLEENVTDSGFWSREGLLVHLNDAMLEFTLIAGQMTSERSYPLISAKWHGTPPGAIAVIHISASSIAIEKTTLESFDRENRNWDRLTGIPKQWSPAGVANFFTDRHYPAATTVVLTTLDEPATLTESSVIDLDDEYGIVLEDYVFHAARFKEGGQEFADAMAEYDDFLNVAGINAKRTFSEMFTIWSREPAAVTGGGYGTPRQ